MKFLGLFILSAALYFSWGLFNGQEGVLSESVHMEVQQILSKELVQIIIESNPDAYNIEVSNFWTETVDENSIEAHFTFSFEQQSENTEAAAGPSKSLSTESAEKFETKVQKKGKTLLKKEREENGLQYWTAEEVELEGQTIEFKQGLSFSGKGVE